MSLSDRKAMDHLDTAARTMTLLITRISFLPTMCTRQDIIKLSLYFPKLENMPQALLLELLRNAPLFSAEPMGAQQC